MAVNVLVSPVTKRCEGSGTSGYLNLRKERKLLFIFVLSIVMIFCYVIEI